MLKFYPRLSYQLRLMERSLLGLVNKRSVKARFAVGKQTLTLYQGVAKNSMGENAADALPSREDATENLASVMFKQRKYLRNKRA